MPKTVLDSYFDLIRDIPVLTQEQEIKLIKKAQAGNKRARNKLIKHNLKLVVNLVKRRFHASKLSLEDLISEGNLGLFEAVNKFDPSKGVKFSTYACQWIRASISRSIMDKGNLVRIPVYLAEKRRVYYDFIRKFEQKHHRLPTVTELTAGINEPSRTVERIRESLISEVEIKETDGVYSSRYETKLDLTKLNFSSERSEIIFRMKFGFEPYKRGYTFEEIGNKFRVSRQRIEQIFSKDLKKISKSKYIKDFFDI